MSRRELFRTEAIEFQRQHRQWGEVALLQPLSTKVLTWFFTVAIALIIVFVSLAQYARKETVVGYLTPTSGTAKIFVPRQGTIEAIHVEQGAGGPRAAASSLKEVSDLTIVSNTARQVGRDNGYATGTRPFGSSNKSSEGVFAHGLSHHQIRR
jgi:hypothetical protein